jgi:hypothetical protein
MKKTDNKSLRDKIVSGLEESFKQLVKDKKRRNETFVWSINGEIVHVKAKDVKLK